LWRAQKRALREGAEPDRRAKEAARRHPSLSQRCEKKGKIKNKK
jgi:hypothetical protein